MSDVRVSGWTQAVALGQWDKMALTLAAACGLPWLVHLLPPATAAATGQQWLPMFYAPLVASVWFRPRVAILAALLAPLCNHLLFGMPAGSLVAGLTLELALFSVAAVALNRWSRLAWWHVPLVFAGARLLLLALTGGLQLQALLTPWPGVVVMSALAEIARRLRPRSHA